jgi:hypothetical protein
MEIPLLTKFLPTRYSRCKHAARAHVLAGTAGRMLSPLKRGGKGEMARQKSWQRIVGVGTSTLAIGLAMLCGSATAFAQRALSATAASPASAAEQDIAAIDMQRGALDRFLDAHPEIENRVFDRPEVMSDPNFLHDHPALQAFLENHPQVKADPRAFISPERRRPDDHPSDLSNVLGDLVPFSVFVCILLALLWVLRTVLENRRWSRTFKVHEEVHAKLIEKFASGQDFSAYLQSDAGRRLLDWTPPALDRSGSLPRGVGRILGSLQAGIVLFLVGIGLVVLRGVLDPRDAPPLLVFGTLGLTLGAGFILSALISYSLSKHLGLIGGTPPGNETLVRQ